MAGGLRLPVSTSIPGLHQGFAGFQDCGCRQTGHRFRRPSNKYSLQLVPSSNKFSIMIKTYHAITANVSSVYFGQKKVVICKCRRSGRTRLAVLELPHCCGLYFDPKIRDVRLYVLGALPNLWEAPQQTSPDVDVASLQTLPFLGPHVSDSHSKGLKGTFCLGMSGVCHRSSSRLFV